MYNQYDQRSFYITPGMLLPIDALIIIYVILYLSGSVSQNGLMDWLIEGFIKGSQ